VFTLEKV
uniref:Uncharacterized protein n=1 Tax=Solanum lycopersicum TaxID=4081 RepID=A0A3Q7EE04_SOLLC